jgi:hypothetical protein
MGEFKMATMIKVDGTEEPVTFRTGEAKLEQWQKIVGGYVEHVKLRDGRHMLCDEDARMKLLPFNPKASILWGGEVRGTVIVCSYEEFRAR